MQLPSSMISPSKMSSSAGGGGSVVILTLAFFCTSSSSCALKLLYSLQHTNFLTFCNNGLTVTRWFISTCVHVPTKWINCQISN